MQKQRSLIRTGKTVDEAIELAVLELGVGRDEVEIDVVSKGRAGILGIGAEPAKVRVSLITDGGSNAGAGLAVVNRLLREMRVEAQATIRSSGAGPDSPPVIDVQGDDAGLVIGHRGETLRALQFITNLVLSRQQGGLANVVVDVEQYRERRTRQLQALAQRMAERTVSTGRPTTLEPMSAADRRVVHVTLADRKEVATGSSGEGGQRRVTIRPARPDSTRPAVGGGNTRSGSGRPAGRRRPVRRYERD